MYRLTSVLRNKRAKLYDYWIVDGDGRAVGKAVAKREGESIVGKLNSCSQLLAALERALHPDAREGRDYDWAGEMQVAIDAAKAAGG